MSFEENRPGFLDSAMIILAALDAVTAERDIAIQKDGIIVTTTEETSTQDNPPFRTGMGVECCDATYAAIRIGDRTRVLSQHWDPDSGQWLVLVAGFRGYWLAGAFRRCRI